jgi:hypothetical protein
MYGRMLGRYERERVDRRCDDAASFVDDWHRLKRENRQPFRRRSATCWDQSPAQPVAGVDLSFDETEPRRSRISAGVANLQVLPEFKQEQHRASSRCQGSQHGCRPGARLFQYSGLPGSHGSTATAGASCISHGSMVRLSRFVLSPLRLIAHFPDIACCLLRSSR